MTWVKLDDGFVEHPKVVALSAEAFRLHVTGISYCNRNLTDGKVPASLAPRLTPGSKAKHLSELDAAGMWARLGDVWVIHDYLVYQRSREQVLAERERNRERVAKHRDKQGGNGVTPEGGNGGGNRAPSSSRPPTAGISHPQQLKATGPLRLAEDEDPRVEEALRLEAKRRVPADVRAPGRYAATVYDGLRGEENLDVEAVRFLTDYPDLTASQLADVLAGNTNLLRTMRRSRVEEIA